MVDSWKSGPLANILSEYSAEDIFNCDETGLFYKMESSKSYLLKGATCTCGKRSKERITVPPSANMTGTEKLIVNALVSFFYTVLNALETIASVCP